MLVAADSVSQELLATLSETLSEFTKLQRFVLMAAGASDEEERMDVMLTLRTSREKDNLEIALEFEGVESLEMDLDSLYFYEQEFWLGDISGRKWADWVDTSERDWEALKWGVSTMGDLAFYARAVQVIELRLV